MEVVITAKQDITISSTDEIEDDFPCIRSCLKYFIYTLSILIVIGGFVVLELQLAIMSSLIEQIPTIWPDIAQAITNAQQENQDINNSDQCANCPVSSFCTCLGSLGSPVIRPS